MDGSCAAVVLKTGLNSKPKGRKHLEISPGCSYGNGSRMFKTWCLLCKKQIAQHRIKSQLRSRTLRWCFSRSSSTSVIRGTIQPSLEGQLAGRENDFLKTYVGYKLFLSKIWVFWLTSIVLLIANAQVVASEGMVLWEQHVRRTCSCWIRLETCCNCKYHTYIYLNFKCANNFNQISQEQFLHPIPSLVGSGQPFPPREPGPKLKTCISGTCRLVKPFCR